LRKQLAALSDPQRSILKRMVEAGEDTPLFSKESLAFYRAVDRELSDPWIDPYVITCYN
jgi:hypothetical protein